MYSYWFFLSLALKNFGGSVRIGDWMLDSALIPTIIIGINTKKTTRSDEMRAGVRSWYLFRIPPSARVVLGANGELYAASNSDWRRKKLGEWEEE
jgi:hypothetical protein